MILASWNVNSIKVRLPNVLKYLNDYKPDVLVLQETKVVDDAFPSDVLRSAGYHSVYCGQKTYNGVAIITKKEPSSHLLNPVYLDREEMRSIVIEYEDITILNVYVVNGKSVDSDKYQYKLDWLQALYTYSSKTLSKTNEFVILGDFNIAPSDNDVPDPNSSKNQILCSDPERESLKKLKDLGLIDLFNKFDFPKNTYTWWDYRAGCFHRDIGYRIDLILATKTIADKCSDYFIDKDTRHKSWCPDEPRTSDHAPVRIII
tara:strand:+ start:71 stop:850 length:780 start_codon:yes stop_codon:yes gene_type:complete